MPRTYAAARSGGTRYHLPGCQALDRTYANHEVDTLTGAQVASSTLTPCALCLRCGMTTVPHLAVA